MKRSKRILSLLLSIVLILGMLPMSVLAADSTFSDVKTLDWFYNDVKYVCEKGLMRGTNSNTFSPKATTTRGMIVTILYRMAGEPAVTGMCSFKDVAAGAYYEKPVIWAAENEIVGGYSASTFDPDGAITREQMAAILYRYAKFCGYDVTASVEIDKFSAADTVSSYALTAMKWASAEGLINGSGSKLDPQGSATRAQVAAILMRFCKRFVDKTGDTTTPATATSTGWHPTPNPDPDSTPKLEIIITNEENPVVTDNTTIAVSGTVISDAGVKSVSAVHTDYYEENTVCTVIGTSSWSFNSDLEIGSNIFTITATDFSGQTVSKTLAVNRNNTQIKYSDTVRVADEDDYQKLYDEIVAVWNDDNNTPTDESDDKIVMLVPQQALLLSQIEKQMLQPGEVYLIPQNELFLTGFSGVYVTHRAPIGNADYPAAEYPDADYEEILFTYPNYSDLFNSDISIDLSSGIDPENPIAFSALPDGTEIDIEYENTTSALAGNDTKSTVVSYAVQTGDMIGNPLYSKKGWITDELKTKMLPKLSASVDRYNRVNVSLKWADVVLYDHDGVKNETAVDDGQVKLSGEFYVKNLKHEGGIEWHPSLWPWDVQILPQQLKSKLSYNYGGKNS